MRCSSESGNSAVMMHVSQPPTSLNTNMYTWMISSNNDTLVASLDLTVDIEDHNALFQCIITSTDFPGMNRSCTIGPIRVTDVKGSLAELTTGTTATEPQPTAKPTPSSTIHSSAIAASVAAGGVLVVAMVTLIICLCNRTQGCRNKSPTTRTETQVSHIDPYTELQKPTNEGNREYMELGTKKVTTSNATKDEGAKGGYVEPASANDKPMESHAEYQSIEDDNNSPGYEYDKPDPKHTEYEEVQAP